MKGGQDGMEKEKALSLLVLPVNPPSSGLLALLTNAM